MRVFRIVLSAILLVVLLYYLYSSYLIDFKINEWFFDSSKSISTNKSCFDLKKELKNHETWELTKEQLNSSFLQKVNFYYVEKETYCIVEMDNSDYVYCGLSNEDVQYFLDAPGTYGEKFNRFIKQYNCDCEP